MRAALIGLPFAGKSTVFQALTGIEAGKKEETIGTIKVPDHRIDKLSKLYNPKKKTYAEFVLSDYSVPPSKDSVVSPKVKNLIQKTDLLIFVLRNFDSIMTADATDAVSEYMALRDEMIITDFIVIERRLEREKKEKKNPPELGILKKLFAILEDNKMPQDGDFTEDEAALLANSNFLTMKKKIVLINQPEGEFEIPEEIKTAIEKDNLEAFCVSAALELELAELSAEEQLEFLNDYGLTETAKERFIRSSYQALGLISFLTAGEDEVRAWPIKNGTPAVQAAGKIHSDIQRGFIRAETIYYEDFIKHGSEAECKKAAAYRLEGKAYTVKDGDIINFRFNV